MVYSTNFEENIMEFNTKTSKAPSQLVWCGVDSIVLAYEKILFMVGPGAPAAACAGNPIRLVVDPLATCAPRL